MGAVRDWWIQTAWWASGIFAPAEVRFFLRNFEGEALRALFFVNASFDIRFRRALVRERSDAPISLEEMKRRDKVQTSMGLGRMASELPFKVVVNEGTLEQYYDAVASQFSDALQNVRAARIKPRIGFLGPLEQTILSFLSDRAPGGEHFTSTQIARLISSGAKNKVEIAKDNVSRYFNQRYSPFYEFITVRHGRKFRLSQTGRALNRFLQNHEIEMQHHRPRPQEKAVELSWG